MKQIVAIYYAIASLLISGMFFFGLVGCVEAEILNLKSDFQTNGSLSTIHQSGDLVFLGGEFSQIERVSTKQQVARQNLAVYNLKENKFIDWSPQINGAVYTIATNSSKIFIGGAFTQVDGLFRQYLAVFQTTSYLLLPWSLNVDQPVWSLALDDTDLYLGGSFQQVAGVGRRYIAIYDLVENRLADWVATVDRPVYFVIVDRRYVTIGGEFRQVNGKNIPYLVTFDKATGGVADTIYPLGQPVYRGLVELNTAYLWNTLNINSSPVAVFEIANRKIVLISILSPTSVVTPIPSGAIMINPHQLGFDIPDFTTVLTFVVRLFFVIGGLAALFYLLLGAFAWITSGGDKDNIKAAQEKIQAAVVGVILIVAVLALVVTLEKIVFNERLCFGVSCPASIPSLIRPLR